MISARVIPPASLYAAGGHPRMQLASCTPTNPIQCKSNYNLGTSGLDGCESPTPWLSVAPGCKFHIVFIGLTGAWSILNDNVDHTNTFYATAVTDSYHFTIPVDGRSLGAGTLERQPVHDVRLGAVRHTLPPETQLQRQWISARAA